MLAWPVCWALHCCALPLPCLCLRMLCPARINAVIGGSVVYVSKETDAHMEHKCSALEKFIFHSKAIM